MYALLALLLPFAGCAAMMTVCARMMHRRGCSKATTTADADELARLRADVAELRGRLDPAGQANRDHLPAG